MKPKPKLPSREQQQTPISLDKTDATSAREFANADEMLRHDAAQAAVPSSVMGRLKRSIERETKPPRSWWQRFFGAGQ